MSAIFILLPSAPLITSTGIVAAIGEKIVIFGENFKRNITKISGQNIYNSSLDFVVNGQFNKNISGIDNSTLNENSVGFTINNAYPSKYKVYLYSDQNISTNYLNLNILNKPQISGFDKKSVLPGDYVRVSGSSFFGGPIYFVDSVGNKVYPSSQETGLYTVTGAEIKNYGTGYAVGNTFNLQGIKNYESNSYASLIVTTTGINGSLGSFNINNSGIFTVPDLKTGIEIVPNNGNGRGALINFLYKRYENTGSFDFIEFQIPYNIKRNQSGIIENIKYPGKSGTVFDGFYISGYPNIYDISPNAGIANSSMVVIRGDNLSLANSFSIGNVQIKSYQLVGDTGVSFIIPNLSSSDYIYASGKYSVEKSANILNISYPPVIASGYSPNNILAGTGTLISISGQHLQRINYINLGQPNITKNNINVNSSGTLATFKLPDLYTATELNIYSVDFPGSGTLIQSTATNNLLNADVQLSLSNINIRYLSGIQAAKYLDEVEIYTSSSTSGNYGNLTNSDVFFLGVTGSLDEPNAYSISGIKINNSPTGIRFKVPREVRNPQARIRIKRNKFGESYILPSTKSIDVLPTIYDITTSNTLYNSLGFLTISGINASNANLIYFSGYNGTRNILGYKDVKSLLVPIIKKDLIQITGINGINGDSNGYSIFEAKLGGDVTGSGELFLFNNYYDTGIGYENEIITKNKNIEVFPISGFRPPNSDIFTISPYATSPIDAPFFHKIETNSRATRFEFSSTTSSGVYAGVFPTGIETSLNSRNEIFGLPSIGGTYYLKIRALDGERPNEGMILTLNVGGSGRAISSPGITYRGEWSNTVSYGATSTRRDVVRYNSDGINYWYSAYTNIDSEPKLGSFDWIPFSNEFSATATKILLAETSNITNSLNIGEAGVLSGFIKTTNDSDADFGSGFFLGFDNRYNYGLPKFRVGNEDGYIKFDGKSLNIAGPISGIITSSRSIKNANNVVDSENSVAVGTSNNIDKSTDNVFIFGANNNITGARRSTILGGQNNQITTYFNSSDTLNSSIVAGEGNSIIGSYSTINGGLGNSIFSASTGLSSISNLIFIKTVNDGINGIINCFYPQGIYTNDLVVFNNIETSRLDFWKRTSFIGNFPFTSAYRSPIYRSKNISEISTQNYLFNLYPTTVSSENLKIHSWVSALSDNLYSGNFIPQDTNKICEFKVGKTGIGTGIKLARINFKNKYVNYQAKDLLILVEPFTSGNLSSVTSSSHQVVGISGLDISGFYIDFPNDLQENTLVSYRIGPTGFYTGSGFNANASMEINRAQPFKNLISGTDGVYDFNLNRQKICFAQGQKYFNKSLNIGYILYYGEDNIEVRNYAIGHLGTHLILSGSSTSESDIVIVANPNQGTYQGSSSNAYADYDQYYNINILGFTGALNDRNVQVFQTGLLGPTLANQTLRRYNINLPSGFTGLNQYVPIFNLYNTGAQLFAGQQFSTSYPFASYFSDKDVYRMLLSGRSGQGFGVLPLTSGDYHRNLNRDYLLNVATFRTGTYTFDEQKIETKRILLNVPTLSGLYDTIQIPKIIKFDSTFNGIPTVFTYLEEVTSGVTFKTVMLNQIFNNGFKVYETGIILNLPSGTPLRYFLNYVAIEGTGKNRFQAKDSVVIDQNLNFSGNVDLPLTAPFTNPIKIFGRSYTQDYDYLHNVYPNTNSSFGFHISDPIKVDLLTGLTYDYMVTDLEVDYNSKGDIISAAEYTRLSEFGFNDIGSSNIAGGTGNYLQGIVSTIGGGVRNRIIGDFNIIGGGRSNIISDHDYSVFNLYPQVAFCNILGGATNAITGNVKYCNILGGQSNIISNDNENLDLNYSNILGGNSNRISGEYSNILGGYNNRISGDYNNILGSNNKVSGYYSTIIGNNSNVQNAFHSMIVNMSGGLIITGDSPSVITLNINSLRTNLTTGTLPVTPIGGIYRSGNFLCIRTV